MATEQLFCQICQTTPEPECFSLHPVNNLNNSTSESIPAEDLFTSACSLLPAEDLPWEQEISSADAQTLILAEQELNDIFKDIDFPSPGPFTTAETNQSKVRIEIGYENNPIHHTCRPLSGRSRVAMFLDNVRLEAGDVPGTETAKQKYVDQISEIQLWARNTLRDLEKAKKAFRLEPERERAWNRAIASGWGKIEWLEKRKTDGLLDLKPVKEWINRLVRINGQIQTLILRGLVEE
ncbi:hypothetical protein BDV18DRAFT_158234 [Aspergillus unguis]